jgi:hypothetical protein
MKRVLVLYYTQTGQLSAIVRRLTAPLQARADVSLRMVALQPQTPFPFPWTFFEFLDIFPESVYLDPPPNRSIDIAAGESFDLVILAYQVWFLSPSLPVTAFLKSDAARRLLVGKPVITVIGCRNMWLIAQEKTKRLLQDLGAHLIDNIVLTDRGGFSTFITTPRWLLTGRKEGFWGLPAAGIAADDIAATARFGHALANALARDEERTGRPLLSGLQAANVDVRLIASERVAHRSFLVWGRLLRAAGPAGSWRRRPILLVYVVFLVALIITVVPISIALKALLRPLIAGALARQKIYYEQPSGSSAERVSPSHE